MELDSFDFIANLVSLGLGVSLVPHRVLALYGNRRAVQRIATRRRFSRELAVVVRRNRITPNPYAHLSKILYFEESNSRSFYAAFPTARNQRQLSSIACVHFSTEPRARSNSLSLQLVESCGHSESRNAAA